MSGADVRLSKFSWGHAFIKMNGHLIERYRTCNTHEEVAEMQERIQREMQEEHDRQKAEKRANEDGDLLRANPNHGGPEWDDDEDEEDEDEEDGDGRPEVKSGRKDALGNDLPDSDEEDGDGRQEIKSGRKDALGNDLPDSDEERDDVEELISGVAATTL